MFTFQEALTYLHSFINYERKPCASYTDREYNLESFRRFMSFCGNPQEKLPALHIAGTKGKGSTAAFCEAGLRGLGYSVGLFTSPHLTSICERIRINGTDISEAYFAQLISELHDLSENAHLLVEKRYRTFFEIVTAVAMIAFAQQGLRCAVYETGLGGRLDTTNIVPASVSGLTSISLDHTKILGETLGAIASEKAGIIKPGQIVITAPQQREALEVIDAVSKERQAKMLRVGSDIIYKICSMTENRMEVDLKYTDDSPVHVSAPLVGKHQAENLAVAYGMIRAFHEQCGIQVDSEALANGFSQVHWLGRFQVFPANSQRPLIIVDGAHNPAAAIVLKDTVNELFKNASLTLVVAFSEDKDYRQFLSILMPLVSRIVCTKFNNPRALEPGLIKTALPSEVSCTIENLSSEAIKTAIEVTPPHGIILITGSLFLVGEALQNL